MADWSDIEKASQARKIEPSEENEKFISLVHGVFNSPDGQELLKKLTDEFLMKPVCPHNLTASYGYYREGQNDVIRQILKCIELHKNSMNRVQEK